MAQLALGQQVGRACTSLATEVIGRSAEQMLSGSWCSIMQIWRRGRQLATRRIILRVALESQTSSTLCWHVELMSTPLTIVGLVAIRARSSPLARQGNCWIHMMLSNRRAKGPARDSLLVCLNRVTFGSCIVALTYRSLLSLLGDELH